MTSPSWYPGTAAGASAEAASGVTGPVALRVCRGPGWRFMGRVPPGTDNNGVQCTGRRRREEALRRRGRRKVGGTTNPELCSELSVLRRSVFLNAEATRLTEESQRRGRENC